jgi:hypothetical protein
LSGEAEITLRSLADLAWALDREVTVELRRADGQAGQNIAGQNIAAQNIAPATSTIGYQPVRIIAPRIIAPKTSNG